MSSAVKTGQCHAGFTVTDALNSGGVHAEEGAMGGVILNMPKALISTAGVASETFADHVDNGLEEDAGPALERLSGMQACVKLAVYRLHITGFIQAYLFVISYENIQCQCLYATPTWSPHTLCEHVV